jgi:hypothetical protein
MFASFLTVLGTTVANKKVLGAWLVILTLSVAQIGSAVFVAGGSQTAVTKKEIEHLGTQIETLTKTVNDMHAKLVEVSGTVLVLKDRSDKANGKK